MSRRRKTGLAGYGPCLLVVAVVATLVVLVMEGLDLLLGR